jgi:hypothetical protein
MYVPSGDTVTDTLTSIQSSKASEAEKRRSTRVALAIAIMVAGIDALGEPFREATTTTEVNCYGCRYRSKNYVQKGSSVTIEIPHPELRSAPHVARGRVIWVQRPRRLREPYEVAMELEVAGNIWGVASPPKDWFLHPDDAKLTIAGSAEQAVLHPPAPSAIAGVDESETLAEVRATPGTILAEPAARLVDPEEVTFTLGLGGQFREPDEKTVRAMVEQIVGAAVQDVVQQATERIMAVIAETQETSRMTAEELEGEIRHMLEKTLSAQPVSPLKSQPARQRRKNSKRGR